MLVDQPMTMTIRVNDLERARAPMKTSLGRTPVSAVPGQAPAYRTGSGQSFLLFLSDEAGAFRVEYDQPELRTEEGFAVTPAGRAAWFRNSEATCSQSAS
jgi:catechol 2,3-dioxygenase-like lactoylglutathione lyase family enzyme